jgi:lysophospholipase L1-like esterase
LPVICGTYAKDSRQCSQQVVDALYRLSREDRHFHVVDASDLSLLPDRLHFNAEGAQTLGQRIYETMVLYGCS